MTVHIDGAKGEGGGQVLRSSLTLSLVTGKPFRITNIRAGRKKPGLRAQHLRAVEAAAAVGDAELEGALLGSTSLHFQPRGIRAGEFSIAIGSAGSSSLVLQTVLVPLSLLHQASLITVSGGTHTRWSPCFHYLHLHWLCYLKEMGFQIELDLERAGYYPEGGGCVRARVTPCDELSSLSLTERGSFSRILGISAVSNLDLEVAERQKRQALNRLQGVVEDIKIDVVSLPSPGKGTMLFLLSKFERAQCCYFALGERGKPAERVADEAVDQLKHFLGREAAVDQYLADQLIVPLALGNGVSSVHTCEITQHLLTNAEVTRAFLPAEIEISGELGQPGMVSIHGHSLYF